MIDLHFHCLPGIDDGPETWEAAVALCRAAAAEGTDTIVATPHVLRHPWLNESRAERAALVAELNDRLGGDPVVLPGCEYFFTADAVELWEQGERGPLTALNGGDYLLIEFPSPAIPRNAQGILYELTLAGVVPVIAHPERNIAFSRDMSQLEAFVSRGARVQVTAASLIGAFGPVALEAADRFLRNGLVHCVASDAHSLDVRPPALAAARRRVAAEWGAEMAMMLFEVNPSEFIAPRRSLGHSFRGVAVQS